MYLSTSFTASGLKFHYLCLVRRFKITGAGQGLGLEYSKGGESCAQENLNNEICVCEWVYRLGLGACGWGGLEGLNTLFLIQIPR